MKGLILLAIAAVFITALSFRTPTLADPVTGAWSRNSSGTEQVLVFMDGYFTSTTYNKTSRKFIQTCGGTYTLGNGQFAITYEFSTDSAGQVGETVSYTGTTKEGLLRTNISGKPEDWKRLDNGSAPLAGLWAITARKQNGSLQPIHQTGTRKTVKILTGSRFQWAAIDPGTKQFMGTGGGTYTFQDGKYTEQIEFFSRDSSRVGSSLSFDGRLEDGNWHHSGLSSRGEPIYEVWSRKKQ